MRAAMNSERKEAVIAVANKLAALNDVLKMINAREIADNEINTIQIQKLTAAIGAINYSIELLNSVEVNDGWE